MWIKRCDICKRTKGVREVKFEVANDVVKSFDLCFDCFIKVVRHVVNRFNSSDKYLINQAMVGATLDQLATRRKYSKVDSTVKSTKDKLASNSTIN